MPEFIDPVFAKTSPKSSFLVIQNERFGLVFTKTGSINSGTGGRGMEDKRSGVNSGDNRMEGKGKMDGRKNKGNKQWRKFF